MRKLVILATGLLVVGMGFLPAQADGGGGGKSRLEPMRKLIEQKKYDRAIDELGEALKESPRDADVLNLIAYSHRQLKRYDIALDYYRKALAIKPKHRGANEYLGELYLQLGQPDKARERLAILDSACFFGCDEYDDLKRAIEEYLLANPPGG